MGMARPDKVEKVEALNRVFSEARSIVLNDFTGLNVKKISELRRVCRESGVEYHVVKNSLAKRSLKGTPAEELEQYLEGPTAIAISNESENITAKVLAKFAAEHEAPKFKAAVVDGSILDATAVIALSKLPSRPELLSQILAGIKSPATGLVSVLQGTVRSLLYVLEAVQQKQSESGKGDPPQQSE
jgi:large subunit ribosomal protein L10